MQLALCSNENWGMVITAAEHATASILMCWTFKGKCNISKLVPSVPLCPCSAAMANDVYVRRPKAASLCGVHSRDTVTCQKLRPGGKRYSESSLHTSVCPQQNFARHGDATMFWLGQTVSEASQSQHNTLDETSALAPSWVLLPLLVLPQLQASNAHSTKAPQKQAKESKSMAMTSYISSFPS